MASISGGDALMKVLAALSDVPSITMNVGVLAGATNEDTTELIAPYAIANEYGTSTIPARPAFRITVAEKTGDWAGYLAEKVKGAAGDPSAIRGAFNGLGSVMVADIRETIEGGVEPENAESTVKAKARKGRAEPDKTLIDSGSYSAAINFEIIQGE